MPRRIDELFYDITARTTGFTKGLARAQSDGKRFLKTLGGPAGLTAGLVAFGAAAVAAGIKATKMAASLDSALREVSTLLPGTVENVSRLREQIIALSTEVPETPELLSRGLYQVISAGITDAAEAMEVLRVAARAATAGLTDTFTSVDAITTVLNAYQLSTTEAGRVSDVFFQTVKAGKLTFGDLAANIGTVATSAALAGVSIEEVGAALATMTKFGISTAESSSSLNRLLLGLTQITDDQAAAAKRLGVEYSLAAVQSKGLVGFLRDLEEATGGNVEALAELNPNIRSARAAFVLAGKGAAEYGRILADTNESAGSTQEAFEKINGSLDSQAKLLKNKINAAWLNLGANILPVVLSTLESINRLLESDAETLARLYRSLGNEAAAAAVEAVEANRALVEGVEEGNKRLRTALDRRANEFREFSKVVREGVDADGQAGIRPGRFASLDGLADQLRLLPRLQGKSRDEQQKLVEEALRYNEQVRRSVELTTDQQLALAEVAKLNANILVSLEAQVARQAAATPPSERVTAINDEVSALKERASILGQAGEATKDEVAEIQKQVALRENELQLIEARADLEKRLAEAPATSAEDAQKRQNVLLRTAADSQEENRDLVLSQAKAYGATSTALQRVSDLEAAREGIAKGVTASIDTQSEAYKAQLERIKGLNDGLAVLEERLRGIADPANASFATLEELSLESQTAEIERFIDLVRDAQQVLADFRSGKGLEAAGEQAGLATSGAFIDFDESGARLLAVKRGIEEILRSTDKLGIKALAVSGLLKTWGVSIEDLPPEIQELIKGLEVSGDKIDENEQKMLDLIQDISFAARSAIELAGAFGLASDAAKEVVNAVSLIGEGIGRIASGDILSGIGGAVSGLAGLVGAVGGPSQSEVERIESEKEIARRLRELSSSIEVLIDVMSQIPGQLGSDLKDALEAGLGGAEIKVDGSILDQLRQNAPISDNLKAALDAAGITVRDITELAKTAGISVDQLIRLLEGENLNSAQLVEALQQAQGLFDAIGDGIVDLTQSVSSRLGLLQASFDRFDIDDPIDQVKALADELGKLGVNLSADDLERLRAGDEGLIEELLRQATTGTGRFTELADLGALTQEELVRFLDELERIGDRLGEDAAVGKEGDFQQVSAQNRFTVEQGNQDLALSATRNFYLEQIRDILRDGEFADIPRPEPAPAPPGIERIDIPPLNVTAEPLDLTPLIDVLRDGLSVQPITLTDTILQAAMQTLRVEHHVSVDVVGGEGLSAAAAGALGRELADGLGVGGVDRSLGSELRKIHAGLGLPPTDTQ